MTFGKLLLDHYDSIIRCPITIYFSVVMRQLLVRVIHNETYGGAIYGVVYEVIYEVIQANFRASLERLWAVKIARYRIAGILAGN